MVGPFGGSSKWPRGLSSEVPQGVTPARRSGTVRLCWDNARLCKYRRAIKLGRWPPYSCIPVLAIVVCLALPLSASAKTSITYSHPDLVDPAGPLVGVSCTSAQVCLAVDFAGSIVGMSAFHSLSLGAGWPAFFDASCASVTFCVALTGTAAVTFLPTETRIHYFDPGADSIAHWDSVSCSSSKFCIAAGGITGGAHAGAGIVAEWNGSRWSTPARVTEPRADGNPTFPQVVCTSEAFCMASDGDGSVIHWNGSKWSPPTYLGPHLADNSFDVTCISSKFCMAIGDDHQVFNWNGSRWLHDADSNLKGSYGLVGCTSPHLCVSVDAAGYAESWDGTSWTPSQFVDPGGDGFDAMSCQPSGLCVAVDRAGNAVVIETNPLNRLPTTCYQSGCITKSA